MINKKCLTVVRRETHDGIEVRVGLRLGAAKVCTFDEMDNDPEAVTKLEEYLKEHVMRLIHGDISDRLVSVQDEMTLPLSTVDRVSVIGVIQKLRNAMKG